MRLIDADTAERYLRETGRIDRHESVLVRQLAGGVSNVVLHVSRRGGKQPDLVLKQARPQLRVADPWFCSPERIWREVEVLRICERVLAEPTDDPQSQATAVKVETPRVVFTDRENYLLAITAAPPHEVWKQQLLDGRTRPAIAQACGHLLGKLHARTWQDDQLAGQIGDRRFFDDLRIDPYYRQIARVHADLNPVIDDLIESLYDHRLALVQGDFSPKNLLVYEGGLMLVDFEVGHFGDPAFDLGFFLSHLALKAFYGAPRFAEYLSLADDFWRIYAEKMANRVGKDELAELVARAVRNFAGCVLARIDGKSKVEYLDEDRRSQARRFSRALLCNPPKTWEDVNTELRSFLQTK